MRALASLLPVRLRVHVAPTAPLDRNDIAAEFELALDPAGADVVIEPGETADGRPILKLRGGGGDGEGSLPADPPAEQLAAAIRAVAAGLVVRIPTERRGLAPFAEPPAAELLTPREYEVLQAMTRGASNKEVARQLGLSLHTVKFYVEAIFRKLDVHSRAEAVAKGFAHLVAGRAEL